MRAALALVVLEQGRAEEALEEALREPEEWASLWALGIIHHAAGRGAESDEALRRLIEIGSETTAIQIAQVHAMRGEADSAFEWLERAYTLRDPGVAEVKTTPRYRSLHGDPRWDAFLRKIGQGE